GGLEDAPVVARHDLHELALLDVPVLEQPGRHGGVGLHTVAPPQALPRDAVLTVERLHVDHVGVDPLAEGALGVVDVGDAARHAGGEVAPGPAQHDHPAPGHVLAAVVTHALDHGHCARVAHAAALPHLAPDERLPGRGPVEDHVAGEDRKSTRLN